MQNRTVQVRLVHMHWGKKVMKAAGNACTWRWVNELRSATTVLGGCSLLFSAQGWHGCRSRPPHVLPCLSGTQQVSHRSLIFLPGCNLKGTESSFGREGKPEGADRGEQQQQNVKQLGASPAAAGGVEVTHARGNALRLPEIYCSLGRFS